MRAVGDGESDGDTLGGTDLDKASHDGARDLGILAKNIWLLYYSNHERGLAGADRASNVRDEHDGCFFAQNEERQS